MGRACSTNVGKRETHVGYWLRKPKGKKRLEDQDVDGWITLRWMSER
jgi:hypothetical protein